MAMIQRRYRFVGHNPRTEERAPSIAFGGIVDSNDDPVVMYETVTYSNDEQNGGTNQGDVDSARADDGWIHDPV